MDQRADDRQLIKLPAELGDWAESNRSMISRLSSAISHKPSMPEEAVWGLIASEYSPEWARAKSQLKSAEHEVHLLSLPENVSLGLIGSALDSHVTNNAHNQHAIALAAFTIVDESLRQHDQLSTLLSAAKEHQRTIAESLELSRNAATMTAAFSKIAGFDIDVAPESPAAKSGFSLQKGQLGRAFQSIHKTMHRTSAALKGGKFQRKPQSSM